jgi:hypothetical protein
MCMVGTLYGIGVHAHGTSCGTWLIPSVVQVLVHG